MIHVTPKSLAALKTTSLGEAPASTSIRNSSCTWFDMQIRQFWLPKKKHHSWASKPKVTWSITKVPFVPQYWWKIMLVLALALDWCLLYLYLKFNFLEWTDYLYFHLTDIALLGKLQISQSLLYSSFFSSSSSPTIFWFTPNIKLRSILLLYRPGKE